MSWLQTFALSVGFITLPAVDAYWFRLSTRPIPRRYLGYT
uniref:Uncharacterized protein n=1 Tax=Anguilla anguilla TaxID=7936 RepID=A0A0E9SCL1_ANGAN